MIGDVLPVHRSVSALAARLDSRFQAPPTSARQASMSPRPTPVGEPTDESASLARLLEGLAVSVEQLEPQVAEIIDRHASKECEVASLANLIRDLGGSIQHLEANVDELVDKSAPEARSDVSLEAVMSQMVELESSLAVVDGGIGRLIGKNRELEEFAEVCRATRDPLLRADLDAMQSDLGQLDRDLETFLTQQRAAGERVAEKMGDVAGELTAMRESLKSAEARCAEAEEENARSVAQCAKLEARNQHLEEEADSARRQQQRAGDAAVAKCAELEAETHRLAARCIELEEANRIAALAAAGAASAALQGQADAPEGRDQQQRSSEAAPAEQQQSEVAARCAELQEENKKLQSCLEDIQAQQTTVASQSEGLGNVNADLAARCAELEASSKASQQEFEICKRDLQARCKSLDEENQKLAERCVVLGKTAETVAGLEEENQRLSAQCSELKEEMNRSQDKDKPPGKNEEGGVPANGDSRDKEQTSAFEARCKHLEEENARLLERCKQLEDESSNAALQMQKQIDEASHDIGNLQDENHAVITRCDELEKANKAAESQIQKLEEQCDEATKLTKELEDANRELQTRVDDLQEQHDDATRQCKELEEELRMKISVDAEDILEQQDWCSSMPLIKWLVGARLQQQTQ